jgi:predicted O-methyltransferase YrrM
MTAARDAEATINAVLSLAYGTEAANSRAGAVRDGMRYEELARLYSVVTEHGCRSAVEIGMACGTSSLAISQALEDNGGGSLVSIDPFQTQSYDGQGLAALRAANLATGHRLIEEPDYAGLPRLLEEGFRCDFVLVDGWHSFDHTFTNFFYADLLLKDGGILMVHDTAMPCVFQACRFLEVLKPYRLISPPVTRQLDSVVARGLRRVRTAFQGAEALRQAKARREEWFALGAYQKLASRQAPQDHAVVT